jgi:predicted HNH restriction endonuclease
LANRSVILQIDQFGVKIRAEVRGIVKPNQGKPRLRKFESNNRKKFHLVPLVLAIARLPDPAREDKTGAVLWPLEDKGFIVASTEFEIIDDDGTDVTMRPLSVRILHAENQAIDLQARFKAIVADIERIPELKDKHPALAEALEKHKSAILEAKNDWSIRVAADEVIEKQTEVFGKTNSAAISIVEGLPPTPLEEDIKGKEGKILTRLHSYRERDRGFVKKAKEAFKAKHVKLFCECCGHDPVIVYGPRGEDRIAAHHRTPVEELMPDTITTPEDLAMVCPNCHDVIHAKRPWMPVEELKAYFDEKMAEVAE